MTTHGEPRLLTTAEVADRLGVTAYTVRRWVADGHLPAVRLPGGTRAQWRFHTADVEAVMAPTATHPGDNR
jgi:excisionase family DNA binding protein